MNSAISGTQLVVLILTDRALLSALVGRLSLHGESLISFDALPDAAALARVPPGSVLIIESANMHRPLLAADNGDRWGLVLVVGERGGDARHIFQVPVSEALATIPDVCARWRASNRD